MAYWTAPPLWEGEQCFIVGGGPSLTGFDFERLRGRRIIVINSSYEVVPFADVLLFGDDRWWHWRRDHARQFEGLIVTCGGILDFRLKRMRAAKPEGPTEDRQALAFRNTSLTAAMNLALHFGVSRMVLLGIDMKAAADGRTHHHKPHPHPSREGCWDRQMKDIVTFVEPLARRGVEVINANPDSRLALWPKHDIGELL
jgi:hypothetical protein